MNVRSSIVATVREVESAVHELQQAGVVALVDVPVRIEWGPGVMEDDPLGGDVRLVVSAIPAVVSSDSSCS